MIIPTTIVLVPSSVPYLPSQYFPLSDLISSTFVPVCSQLEWAYCSHSNVTSLLCLHSSIECVSLSKFQSHWSVQMSERHNFTIMTTTVSQCVLCKSVAYSTHSSNATNRVYVHMVLSASLRLSHVSSLWSFVWEDTPPSIISVCIIIIYSQYRVSPLTRLILFSPLSILSVRVQLWQYQFTPRSTRRDMFSLEYNSQCVDIFLRDKIIV